MSRQILSSGTGGSSGGGGGGGGGVTSVGASFPLASSGGATPNITAQALFPLFVYRPGGSAGPNVFTDWATLATAANSLDGPKSIFVDCRFAGGDGNAHVPAGGWSLGQYYLLGDPNVTALGKGLLFEDGASLSQLPMDCQSIALSSVSNSFVFESDGEFENLILSKNSSIGSANAPFIKMDGSDQIEVQLLEGSSFLANGAPCVSVTNGGVAVIALENALVQANTIEATGTGTTEIDYVDSADVDSTQSPDPTMTQLSKSTRMDFSGGITVDGGTFQVFGENIGAQYFIANDTTGAVAIGSTTSASITTSTTNAFVADNTGNTSINGIGSASIGLDSSGNVAVRSNDGGATAANVTVTAGQGSVQSGNITLSTSDSAPSGGTPGAISLNSAGTLTATGSVVNLESNGSALLSSSGATLLLSGNNADIHAYADGQVQIASFGSLQVFTRDMSGASSSDISIVTGASDSAQTGTISIVTSDSVTGTPGQINMQTGSSNAAGANFNIALGGGHYNGGTFSVTAGASDYNGGNINFTAGASNPGQGGSGGSITFRGGTGDNVSGNINLVTVAGIAGGSTPGAIALNSAGGVTIASGSTTNVASDGAIEIRATNNTGPSNNILIVTNDSGGSAGSITLQTGTGSTSGDVTVLSGGGVSLTADAGAFVQIQGGTIQMNPSAGGAIMTLNSFGAVSFTSGSGQPITLNADTHTQLNGPVQCNSSINCASTSIFQADLDVQGTLDVRGNTSIGAATGSYGGGAGVMFVANATTVPTSNPTGGGVLFVQGGALKYRGSSGTVTTIAPA